MSVLAQSALGPVPSPECRLIPPNGRIVSLKSPFFFRGVPWNLISKENATALCSAVRQLGAAISIPISTMEQLPAASIPLRVAQLWTDRATDLSEIEMSDIIEFNFCSERSSQAETYKQPLGADSIVPWPIDVVDSTGLQHRISMLREITEYKIPIGFAIPAGNVREDVTLALDCDVDFVVLTWSPSLFEEKGGLLPSISVAEALLEAAEAKQKHLDPKRPANELKIIVDAPLANLEDFAKLFALGASGWNGQTAIDSILRQAPPPQTNVGYSGMLSNYNTPNRAPSIQPQIIERLQKYTRSLEYILARCGKAKPSELATADLYELRS